MKVTRARLSALHVWTTFLVLELICLSLFALDLFTTYQYLALEPYFSDRYTYFEDGSIASHQHIRIAPIETHPLALANPWIEFSIITLICLIGSATPNTWKWKMPNALFIALLIYPVVNNIYQYFTY